MKPFPSAFGVLGLLCVAFSHWQTSKPEALIIAGDFRGHLEPCGCTIPQIGGIQRLGSLIEAVRKTTPTTVLLNGSLVADGQEQSQFKIETLALAAKEWNVAAINISSEDSQLGPSGFLSVENLASGKLVSGSIEPKESLAAQRSIATGAFLIGGASSHAEAIGARLHTTPADLSSYLSQIESDATQDGLTPILLLDGTLDDAIKIASDHPKLRGIVYRSSDNPSAQILWKGKTALISPGSEGKYALRLTFDGGSVASSQPIPLSPQYKDDPKTSEIYAAYVQRVDGSHLLDHLPRVKTDLFAGSFACQKCHQSAFSKWSSSAHHKAYQTLAIVRHSRDPDCVSCHVVGLNSQSGFRSASQSYPLASVGCEACHGPARLHAKSPSKQKLKKIDERTCVTCHTTDQDPNFNSLTFKRHYWPLIRH